MRHGCGWRLLRGRGCCRRRRAVGQCPHVIARLSWREPPSIASTGTLTSDIPVHVAAASVGNMYESVPRKRKWTEDSRGAQEEDSTEFKMALLASSHAELDESTLLEALLASDGSVSQASAWLTQASITSPKKRPTVSTIGYQSSLTSYCTTLAKGTPVKTSLIKKGKTLFLYTPADIEAYTPCSIVHNFLPAKQADALLLQLLEEAPTYQRLEFKLFDRVVSSPHTFCFYVNSLAEAEEQKAEYIYDGRQVEASIDA